MANIEEGWSPFQVQVIIEGALKPLLVVPDQEEPRYEVFDQYTSLGTLWQEQDKTGKIWCGEGTAVQALLEPLAAQIENYLANKPV